MAVRAASPQVPMARAWVPSRPARPVPAPLVQCTPSQHNGYATPPPLATILSPVSSAPTPVSDSTQSKRGVFFDFDSTITTPIRLPRFPKSAVADRPDIFQNMTSDEIVSNFGGPRRLDRLASLFRALREEGCELFIISLGFREPCILPHLRAVGLAKFFCEDSVFGHESEALSQRNWNKAQLISEIMAVRGWESRDALFVDDSARHVEAAAGLLDVVKVAGRGMSEVEMDAILTVARHGGTSVSALEDDGTWILRLLDCSPEPVDVGAWIVVDTSEGSQQSPGRAASLDRSMTKSPMPSRLGSGFSKRSPTTSPRCGTVSASPASARQRRENAPSFRDSGVASERLASGEPASPPVRGAGPPRRSPIGGMSSPAADRLLERSRRCSTGSPQPVQSRQGSKGSPFSSGGPRGRESTGGPPQRGPSPGGGGASTPPRSFGQAHDRARRRLGAVSPVQAPAAAPIAEVVTDGSGHVSSPQLSQVWPPMVIAPGAAKDGGRKPSF